VFDCYSCFVAPFEPKNAEKRADERIQGSMLVQIKRNTAKFPARPHVYLIGGRTPLELKPLGDPEIPNDRVEVAAGEELSTFLLMLPSNYITMTDDYEIVIRFPDNPDQDVKDISVVKRISVNDSHIIQTTIDRTTERDSLVSFYPLPAFKTAAEVAAAAGNQAAPAAQVVPLSSAKPERINDLQFVQAAISRYSMIPNRRYPYKNNVMNDFNWTNRDVGQTQRKTARPRAPAKKTAP
jgi:hypothetical protein